MCSGKSPRRGGRGRPRGACPGSRSTTAKSTSYVVSPGSGSIDHSRYRSERPSAPSWPPCDGARRERLARAVGDEQRDAAGARVREGRPHAVAQVVLGRHVRDRVVHEHGVERPPEPERPHVAEDVLAVRIQRPR